MFAVGCSDWVFHHPYHFAYIGTIHVMSSQQHQSVKLLLNILASQIPQLVLHLIRGATTLPTAILKVVSLNSTVVGKTRAIVVAWPMVRDNIMINAFAKALLLPPLPQQPPPPPQQVC